MRRAFVLVFASFGLLFAAALPAALLAPREAVATSLITGGGVATSVNGPAICVHPINDSSGTTWASFDCTGKLTLNGTTAALLAAGGALSINTSLAAASTSAGLLVDTNGITRTAGVLLQVNNNGTSYFSVASSGNITFGASSWMINAGSQTLSGNYLAINNGGYIIAPKITWNGSSTGVVVQGNQVAAGTGADVISTGQATRTAGLIHDFQNNGVSKRSVDFNGKEVVPTGGAADVAGCAAVLAAGVVTISTTAVTASSVVQLTHKGINTTNLGTLYLGTVTAGTSFQIKSSNAADTDTVCWQILN